MSIKQRHDSITLVRLREALETKVASEATLVDGNVNLHIGDRTVCTGTMVKFTAPCSCDKVTGGLTINGVAYAVVDAMGECMTGSGGVWASGAQIAVLIDNENKVACIQNAATKGILDNLNSHIDDKNNPHEVSADQVEVEQDVVDALNLASQTKVNDALLALSLGKSSIATGTYEGTQNSYNDFVEFSVTFPFKPKLILCIPDTENAVYGGQRTWMYAGAPVIVTNSVETSVASGTTVHPITFSGNTATIRPLTDDAGTCYWICQKGATYHWVAIA